MQRTALKENKFCYLKQTVANKRLLQQPIAAVGPSHGWCFSTMR